MSENYNTRTASLKATIANIRNLDAKKIVLNGEDILDRISDSQFHSYDTRDPQLKNDELDIWNAEISLSDNGCIEVKPHVHGVDAEDTSQDTYYTYEGMTESQANTIKTAVKVVDNEVLGTDDSHIMYWQTDGLTSGDQMFAYRSSLTSFNSDLSSLTDGTSMFIGCTNLTSFSGDLCNIDIGTNMFSGCTSLTSFNSDLSSLAIGIYMFQNTSLTSFNNYLSNLINGEAMFSNCTSLTSFSGDLSSLVDGYNMFNGCINLTSFTSNLSSLSSGSNMFDGTKLDAMSVANIIHTLPTRNTNEVITIGLGIDDTDEARQALAEAIWCKDWDDVNQEFANKNWTVTWQFNGAPTE